MMEILSCAVFMAVVLTVSCKDDITNAMLKLEDYGYLGGAAQGTGLLRDSSAVNNAVKDFQAYAGLITTGTLDEATVNKLQEPRCGMADPKKSKRGKRYVHQGSKWKKQKLTFKIINYSAYTRRLRQSAVRRTIHITLSKWMNVTNLEFVETRSDDADIRIRFVRRSHSDSYPFDGRGGTLAHAFYPMSNKGLAGDAHFDDDEYFTLRSKTGTNFYWVALHEFGHSIGMEHSNKLGAVMYPWYQGYKGDEVELTPDDVQGIQSLYGVRRKDPKVETTAAKPVRTLTTTAAPKKKAPQCINRIKAVLFGGDRKTYVINDDQVYVLGTFLKLENDPVPIGTMFPGLKKIDAAMKAENGELVFFHKDQYWIYDGYRLRSGPNHISKYGLLNEMNDLDGVFSWKGYNKQYFFKGDRFWRFDAVKKRIDPGYPKIMKSWDGIPSNIDSVFQWRNKALYFFKGDQFYRFDTRRIQAVKGYPKKIQGDFVVCSAEGRAAGMSAGVTVDSNIKGSSDGFSKATSEKTSLYFTLFLLLCTALVREF